MVILCRLEPFQVPLDRVNRQAGLAARLPLRVALGLHLRQNRSVCHKAVGPAQRLTLRPYALEPRLGEPLILLAPLELDRDRADLDTTASRT